MPTYSFVWFGEEDRYYLRLGRRQVRLPLRVLRLLGSKF